MSPSHVLMTRFALEAELTCVPSRTGEQCEALREQRQELGGGRMGKLIAYQDLILLTKDLTSDELRICRLRYGCTAGIERYERIVTSHDLEDAERWQGETMLPGRMGAVADNPDLRKVVGIRARLPDFQQIAESLPETTARQVKRLLETARAKVAVAIKWRTLRATIEERYE